MSYISADYLATIRTTKTATFHPLNYFLYKIGFKIEEDLPVFHSPPSQRVGSSPHFATPPPEFAGFAGFAGAARCSQVLRPPDILAPSSLLFSFLRQISFNFSLFAHNLLIRCLPETRISLACIHIPSFKDEQQKETD